MTAMRRVLFVLLLLGSTALAKSDRTFKWKADRIFPTAVRFLRVDEHATIVDKDADSGYVVFDFADDGKTYHGSLEVVRVTDDPPEVKVIIELEDRPPWMESAMLDKLEQKLHDELGDPPDPPPAPPPPPAPDPAPK
jgi:hypothetical protein